MNTPADDGPNLADWLQGAELNRDCNLRLQYLARVTPDVQTAQEIFESMTNHRMRTIPAEPDPNVPFDGLTN